MITLQQHISEGILDVDLDIELPQLKNWGYFEDHFVFPIQKITNVASNSFSSKSRKYYLEARTTYKSGLLYQFENFYSKVVGPGHKTSRKNILLEFDRNKESCSIIIGLNRSKKVDNVEIINNVTHESLTIGTYQIQDKEGHWQVHECINDISQKNILLIGDYAFTEYINIPVFFFDLLKQVLLSKA